MDPRDASPDRAADERATGLPAFGTWRGVYWFVLVVFVVWVVLLKVFELAFS